MPKPLHNTDLSPEDRLKAVVISTRAANAAKEIVELMRVKGLTNACYAYKFRVKSDDDLLSKRARKREKKPEYEITDITDVIGIRLVTLFKGDMYSVYEYLLDLLSTKSNDSLLDQSPPEEIIVYKGTSALDDLSNEIKRITKKHFKSATIQVENSQAGYSSIHVICRHSQWTEKKGTDLRIKIPIEIQIRTVFEDAWGEIDHRYGYVVREGKDAGDPIINSVHIKAHLKVLKDFADACMDYAECIRKEATEDSDATPSGHTKTIPVEANEETRLKSAGMEGDFILRFIDACRIRDEAASLIHCTTIGDNEAVKKYLIAADMFSTLAQEIATEDHVSALRDGKRIAYYLCSMNEGICLLSSGSPSPIRSAVEKYRSIESNYKNFPLVKMRHGQALRDAGRVDEAIEKLREANDQFRKIGAKNSNDGEWTDELPLADYEHMLFTLPKVLGYTLWIKTQTNESMPKAEKANLFYDAYTITLQCREAGNLDSQKKQDIVNNLLYFSAGFVFYSSPTDNRTSILISDTRELLRSYIESGISYEEIDLEMLDTVFRVHALLSEPSTKEIAELVVRRCLRSDTGLTNDLVLNIGRVAQAYLDTGTIIAF